MEKSEIKEGLPEMFCISMGVYLQLATSESWERW